jgi:hypothetical protein
MWRDRTGTIEATSSQDWCFVPSPDGKILNVCDWVQQKIPRQRVVFSRLSAKGVANNMSVTELELCPCIVLYCTIKLSFEGACRSERVETVIESTE